MDLVPLTKAAHALGLDALLPLLVSYALPAVHFDLTPLGERPLPVGQSRLGGNPDLPDTFDWPAWHDHPLSFLAQINLIDITPHAPPDMLPPTGMLSFFYDLDEQPRGYDPQQLGGFRVTYTPATIPLQRIIQPSGAEQLLPCLMTFTPCLTLPHYGSWSYNQLQMQVDINGMYWDGYWKLSEQLLRLSSQAERPRWNQLLGHSANVQGDMQLEAQLVSHGIYCGDPSGYQSPRAHELALGAREWILLLQLDTDDPENTMPCDGCYLYFWIRQSDLRQLLLERVWVTMQCD